jgi:hypothetical protein
MPLEGKVMARIQKSEKVSKEMQAVFDAIVVALTDKFCKDYQCKRRLQAGPGALFHVSE